MSEASRDPHAAAGDLRDSTRSLLSVEIAEALPGVLVVKPRGEIDVPSTRVLDHALDAVLASRPRAVIVDLDAAEFLAAAGVRALIDAQATAQSSSTGFRVAGGNNVVLRVFHIAHLRRLVAPLFESVAHALVKIESSNPRF